MGAISIGTSELIALFAESIFFGVLSILYPMAIMALVVRLREERKWKATRVKLATATIMYVLAMVHLALDVHRATLAFADLAGQSAKLEHYYTQVDDPTHVAKSAIYTVQTMVGESFAIYRVWLVWSWSLLVVLPAILLISTGIIGFIACSQFAHTHSDQGVFSPLLKTWITVFFALALVTSLVSTCLIAGRILWSNHKVRHFCDGGSAQGSNTLASDAILQSSAIYAACLIALLGAYASGSNAQYILLDALQPIIGIVFVLVIVRVGSGNSRRDDASGVELGPVKASQSASARSRFPPLSISLDLSSPSVDQSRQTASHSSQHGIDNLDKSGPLLAAKGSFLINPRSDGVTWEEAQPYTPPSA